MSEDITKVVDFRNYRCAKRIAKLYGHEEPEWIKAWEGKLMLDQLRNELYEEPEFTLTEDQFYSRLEKLLGLCEKNPEFAKACGFTNP